jgi:hypothetical protein
MPDRQSFEGSASSPTSIFPSTNINFLTAVFVSFSIDVVIISDDFPISGVFTSLH